MTTYYKCTRPDGTDFRTGTVDYGAALLSGEIIRHPAAKRVKDEPSTYLSVSIAPADCAGMEWPCRLFRVRPIGRTVRATDRPNKRGCSALRVVEELPAWQALGPNGRDVVAIIAQAGAMTAAQAQQLYAARAAARDAAGAAAWSAARDAARAAAWSAAWAAAWAAARDAAGAAAWSAARDAARAYVVRDLITPEQFAALAGPWLSVVGELANEERIGS